MRRLWATREIDAPAGVLWELLVDPEAWPAWGPSVSRAVVYGGRLGVGARGTVTTAFGVTLPFEVTGYHEGARWGWTVAGVPATEHIVEPLGAERCRAGFGVPWLAAPYLVVCRVALSRLVGIAGSARDDGAQ